MKHVVLLPFLVFYLQGIQASTLKSSLFSFPESNSNSISQSNRNFQRQPQIPRRILFPSSITQDATTSTTTIPPSLTTKAVFTTLLPNVIHYGGNSTEEHKEKILFPNSSPIDNGLAPTGLNSVNGTEDEISKKLMDICHSVNSGENDISSELKGPTSQNFLSDEFIKSKLCPNKTENILQSKYRFDLEAKVCSEMGQQSHCGKYMVFNAYMGSTIYGYCDCDYANQTGCIGNAPLIYHKETNRCYYIYTKAFCGEEVWLEMQKDGNMPVCKRNKCFNSGRLKKFGSPPLAARDAPPEYVPLKGDGPCVKLNEPNKQHCENKGDIVAFRWPLEFYPNCGPLPIKARFLGEVSSPECNPGSYLNAIGHCQPSWEFD